MKPIRHQSICENRFEALETRRMFSGNVSAEVISGDVVIRGDSRDNQILITQLESGALYIEGLDGTRINGSASAELAGLTDDLTIKMEQGGTDDVALQGGMDIPDDLTAQIGEGELLVEGSLGAMSIGDDLTLRTGSRGHATVRNDVRVAGDASVKAGATDIVSGRATLPDFEGAEFDTSTTINNAYFPVVPGTKWTYEAQVVDEDTGDVQDETIVVEVLNETKTIEGVVCRIIRDRVYLDGVLIEDTFDWYAQDNNGNVWYFGEDVTNFDYDENGNLISTDKGGSWIAGEDNALPGTIMEANVRVGHGYYQEFAPGNVLDQAIGLATDETVTTPVATHHNVYRTKENSVVEPLSFANKQYAPGLGTVVEYDYDIEDNEVLKTTTLISVTLNGQPVTQLVPTDFDGINADGEAIGGTDIGGGLTVRARGLVAINGAEVDQSVSVRTKDLLLVVDSHFSDNASFSTIDTITLRGVFAEQRVRTEDASDVFIFDSDISRFKGLFGRADNVLAVQNSTFDEFYADGGRGHNTFEDRGDSSFGSLTLKRFDPA